MQPVAILIPFDELIAEATAVQLLGIPMTDADILS